MGYWTLALRALPVSCLLVLSHLAALPAAAAVVDYTFDVTYFEVDPDQTGYTWVQGINGVLPGPEIRVRQHDTLRVRVVNHLQTEKISIHWHGFEMRSAQEYDGAMGITQCGIKPNTTFVYEFAVDEAPGTYLYHEHAGMEHVAARGLFGALVVEPPAGAAQRFQYDEDAAVVINDWWKKAPHAVDLGKWAGLSRPNTVSKLFNDVGLQPFHNLLINGRGAFAVFGAHNRGAGDGWVTRHTRITDLAHISPRAGETWRLRVANAGALFAVRLRIDGHRLRVIQADAADVEPYDCDAVTMSAGERFDVLVTFDRAPGSYWMRVETLESNYGFHHGQLGVVRYAGTPEGVEPDMGFPRAHQIADAPELVTLNCVDQGLRSETCLPITALRNAHPEDASHHAGHRTDHPHDFEVSYRGLGKPDDSHFTRVLDLAAARNAFELDQFGGEFVQFSPPSVPYTHVNGSTAGQHPNTLTMRVELGETVRVILQTQDRTSHPWHLHGHKFAVLGTGFPDYSKECDVLHCKGAHLPWLSRDGLPGDLLDPATAPLKDTVHVPAGGWAVIQFKANNPGWWYFHCHMLIHVLDGMGLALLEGSGDALPPRLTDLSHLEARGFPSCGTELYKLQSNGPGFTCQCWQDPEMYLDNRPRRTYRCSQPYLCGHEVHSELEPTGESRMGKRDRAAGRLWRLVMLAIELFLLFLVFRCKHWSRRHQAAEAAKMQEFVDLLKRAIASTTLRRSATDSRSTGVGSWSTAAVSSRRLSVGSRPALDTTDEACPVMPVPSIRMSQSSMQSFRSNRSSKVFLAKLDANSKGSMAQVLKINDLPSVNLPVKWSARSEPEHSEASAQVDALRLELLEMPHTCGKEELQALRARLTDAECRRRWAVQHDGEIPRGSVLALLGTSTCVDPWLNFFAGRNSASKAQIKGDLALGGIPVEEWGAKDLRRARGYVSDLRISRPTCTVAEALDLHLRLTNAPELYGVGNEAERFRHSAKFIHLFHLNDCVGVRLTALDRELLMRVKIAQELVVPRGVLVIKDPLEQLEQKHRERMVHLFAYLAQKLGVTIIFSCMSLAGECCDGVTHMMVCTGQGWTPFGNPAAIEDFCARPGVGLPVHGGKHPFEWCSELLFKGLLSAGNTGRASISSRDSIDTVSDNRKLSQFSRASDFWQENWEADTDDGSEDGVKVGAVVPGDMPTPVSPFASTPPDPSSPRELPSQPEPQRAEPEIDSEVCPEPPSPGSGTDVPLYSCAPLAPPAWDLAECGSARDSQCSSSVSSRMYLVQQVCKVHSAASKFNSFVMVTKPSVDLFSARSQRPFLIQCWILFKYEILSSIEDSMTIYKFTETVGIAVLAGVVWFRTGASETQTSLGEAIGLFFFSTALWTVPPVFQALAATPIMLMRAKTECLGGLYKVSAFVVAMGLASFLTSMVWVWIWQMTTYTLADVGPSWHAMLTMHLVLTLNVFTMRTIGLFIGMVVPSTMLNVVLGNLFAQMCMLTNGFYTVLPSWLQWITVFSIPRYTFRALLKLEYSWRDTFEVHPMLGAGGVGFPTRFIPAELTGTFQLMKTREMDIMQSPHDSSVWPDVGCLLGISVLFLALFWLALLRKVQSSEVSANRRACMTR